MSTILHDSDCAIHNAPALPPGPCDCGVADIERQAATIASLRETLKPFADLVVLYDRSDAQRRQHEVDELGPNYRKPYVTPDIHQVSVNLGWLRKAHAALTPIDTL